MLRRYLDPYQPKPKPASSFWNARWGAVRWAQARHWLDILVGQAGRIRYVGHLKAAVYADMVGYSRLFRQDDAGTVARLRNLHRVIGPAIRRHYGSLVQTAGDSLLITFDSITEAVRCAVTIQHAVAKENDGWPDDRRMWLRVGVDLGDVITDGRDFHGDGVIVAVRLQEVCPPGGVCISRAVHEHGGDRLGLPFEALGALTLKNIVHPVEAFVLRPPHDERTATLRLVE
jgi:adenylate cyclase